jgi:hypothetical protein
VSEANKAALRRSNLRALAPGTEAAEHERVEQAFRPAVRNLDDRALAPEVTSAAKAGEHDRPDAGLKPCSTLSRPDDLKVEEIGFFRSPDHQIT